MKPLTLEEVLDRNAEWIVPTAWSDEPHPETGEPLRVAGGAIIRARTLEMQRRNIVLRAELLDRAENDPAFQAEELRKCSLDIVYWLTRYGWIFDANERKFVPFLPFQAQVEKLFYPAYLDLVTPLSSRDERRDQIIMKSRYLGVTFAFLLVGGWAARFYGEWFPGVPFIMTVGANKLEKLDRSGSPDTHFGRLWLVLKTIFEQAPWMYPEMAKNRGMRSHLHIAFPNRNAVIQGEAVNENFGRSGRSTITFLDEEAFAPEAHLALMGLSDNTNCTRRVSTVNGHDPSFMATWRNEDIKIRRDKLLWSECPWYDGVWYEAQKSHRGPASVAQELDCDPDASAEDRYWADFREGHNVVPDEMVPVVPGTPIFVGIDPGYSDGCALSFWQVDRERGLFVCRGYMYRRPARLDDVIPFLLGHVPAQDKLGRPWQPSVPFGPLERDWVGRLASDFRTAGQVFYLGGTDMSQTTMHADPVCEELYRRWGIPVTMVRLQNKWEAIKRVQKMLHYIRVPRSVAEARGICDTNHTIVDVFHQYRAKPRKDPYAADKDLKPLHNEYSNGADTIQYFAAHAGLMMPVLSEEERKRGMFTPKPMKGNPEIERLRRAALAVYGNR